MITILKKGVGSATHKRDTTKKVFDPYSRKHYGDRYKGMKGVLDGAEVPSMNIHPEGVRGKFKLIDRIQDINDYRRGMEMNKKHYERGHAITLTPDVKNALWRKALRLKQEISVGMISKDELHPVRVATKIINGSAKQVTVVDEEQMRRTRVVERNNAWYKKNDPKMKEFKRIMRVLEPDDPKITSIVEGWRPRSPQRRKK
jgi:hypothetical protein